MEIPTVKIKGEDGGYIVINEIDYDASVHEFYSEEPPKPPAKGKAKDGE